MALARLALKSLRQRAPSASFLSRNVSPAQNQGWASQIIRRLSSAAEEKPDSGREVAVADRSKKPRRKRRGGLWRSNSRDNVIPALWESFPSGLGNALLEATDNINRLMETFSPSQLMGRVREHDDTYKLRYYMPGLAKEDVKVTINDGVLSIRGEHKHEEEGEESEDDFWSAKSYGYYNTSLLLPEDAKVDEIKAEMKDGVLNIVIPKIETAKKDVQEVEVQ